MPRRLSFVPRTATALGGLALAGGVALGAKPTSWGLAPPRDSPWWRSAAAKTTMRAVSTSSSDDDMGRVQSIHRYPVKSCGGETLDEVGLTRLSPLPGDRCYLWVDAEGKFLTGHTSPGRLVRVPAGLQKKNPVSVLFFFMVCRST